MIPFRMLLRGANAVGCSSYPDNVVHKFCDVAVRHGIDVVRVFDDSLNYIDNLKLGIDAVGAAGGVVEAAVCYTGDAFSGEAGARGTDYKYKLDCYLSLARQRVEGGTHVLTIKDMVGLLTPQSARMLVGALRKEFPGLPIHVHTLDTAAMGVASMVATIEAGADVVDSATDAVSGSTSQPSMGALVAALARTPHATDLDPKQLNVINDYWEECRQVYSPLESGRLTGSADVYQHEISGGNSPTSSSSPSIWALRAICPHQARLHRREPHPRRHHQGDAQQQGGRRPCAVHGGEPASSAGRAPSSPPRGDTIGPLRPQHIQIPLQWLLHQARKIQVLPRMADKQRAEAATNVRKAADGSTRPKWKFAADACV